MTSLPQSAMPISAPRPVLALSYCTQPRRLPKILRLGGLFGLLAGVLTLPIVHYRPSDVIDPYLDPYIAAIITAILPRLQLLLIGAGFTMVCVGRRSDVQCSRAGFWVAIALNLIGLTIASGVHLPTAPARPIRWTCIGSSI